MINVIHTNKSSGGSSIISNTQRCLKTKSLRTTGLYNLINSFIVLPFAQTKNLLVIFHSFLSLVFLYLCYYQNLLRSTNKIYLWPAHFLQSLLRHHNLRPMSSLTWQQYLCWHPCFSSCLTPIHSFTQQGSFI